MKQLIKTFSSIDMTIGTPWKKLLLFAVPLLIGNIFQQFYSIADAIILGQFVGDYALAAVGSSMPIFSLIMVLLMGISIGTGIMVSQYFGGKRREDLSHTIGNCITITAILSVSMMLIGPLATRPLLILLDTPSEILNDSVAYMNILLWGVLGLAYFNILSGILRGLGDAFSSLLYLAIACLLNVVLNFLFIAVFGWGVASVAVGTVIAQGISSILCLSRLMKMRETFDMGWKYLPLKKQYSKQILKLGVFTGASQAIIAVAMIVVQPLVNSFGPLFIATSVIVMRIDALVMMPIFSFGNAMTVFAGQNMGAGKIDRIEQATKQNVIMAMGTSIVLVIVILVFGRFIAGAFTQTQEVIDLSQRMLRILAPGFIAFSVAMVLWGTIRGSGDVVSPLWSSLVNTLVIRMPTAFLFVHLIGEPQALMYSMVSAWTVNMILSIIVYRIGKWRTKKLVRTSAAAEDESDVE